MMKKREDIITELLRAKKPKIDLSLLTDNELNIAARLLKANEQLVLMPISRAIADGFQIPDNHDTLETELLKFYLNKHK